MNEFIARKICYVLNTKSRKEEKRRNREYQAYILTSTSELAQSPCLQGPENDYGDYDYMIDYVPSNGAEWIDGECHCDGCGRNSSVSKRYTSYFHTLDGYDSMDYTSCWKCEVAGVRSHVRHKVLKWKKATKHDLHMLTLKKSLIKLSK